MRVRPLVPFIPALFIAAGLNAQGADISATADFDWKAETARVSVSRGLDQSIPSLQRAENEAETAIDAGFTGLLLKALSPLAIDSSRTVGSLAGSDPGFFAWIQGLARSARKVSLHLSADMKTATAGYELPFFTEAGIASPLYPGEDSRIDRRLGFVPTRGFSGLVVYALDPLPAVGGAGNQSAAPALFPKFFDEEMNVFFEKGMCRPAALAKWGMLGYTDSQDQSAILTRCGKNPLIVVARAVFGVNRTDLVIPTRAVEQILAMAENIEILKEGRVLVICPLPKQGG